MMYHEIKEMLKKALSEKCTITKMVRNRAEEITIISRYSKYEFIVLISAKILISHCCYRCIDQ